MIKKSILSLVVMTFLWMPCLSLAAPCVFHETESEKVALARIYQVLKSLKPLILEAKAAQDKTKRIQFQYEKLEADLLKIEKGIDDYFHPLSIQPRTIQPIHGDYVK
jgi:RAQPRD family integrative conjugative element protein